MPISTINSDGLASPAQYTGFKNRIINGAMIISQYNGTNAVTPSVITYPIDRWQYSVSQGSKFTIQQGVSGGPVGVCPTNLGLTVASAVSVGAGDYFVLGQAIEGFNFADLGFGTSSAKAVTVSFYVQSSLIGTFGGSLANGANTRSYPFSYSIPVANTWTYCSVTIPGDTAGTWIGATNAAAAKLHFSLGTGTTYSGTAGSWAGTNYVSATGATSVVGTSGATFYITGVQLEVGSTATSFDVRDYGRELIMCQRYYQNYASPMLRGVTASTTDVSRAGMVLPVVMRAAPTLIIINTLQVFDGQSTGTVTSITNSYSTTTGIELDAVLATGSFGSQRPVVCYQGTGRLGVSAEL